MGYTVSFDEDDELDELFEFGLDGEPLSDLMDMDGLSDEQKQALLMGKTAGSEFDREFHDLFGHRESLITQIFEMEFTDDKADDDE